MATPQALRALNEAAYAAIKALAADPRADVNRRNLHRIALETDALVDALTPEPRA